MTSVPLSRLPLQLPLVHCTRHRKASTLADSPDPVKRRAADPAGQPLRADSPTIQPAAGLLVSSAASPAAAAPSPHLTTCPSSARPPARLQLTPARHTQRSRQKWVEITTRQKRPGTLRAAAIPRDQNPPHCAFLRLPLPDITATTSRSPSPPLLPPLQLNRGCASPPSRSRSRSHPHAWRPLSPRDYWSPVFFWV